MNAELSTPATFTMRLPAEELERLQRESAEEMIPLNLVARRYLRRGLNSGVSVAPETSRKSTTKVEKVQDDGD